MNYETRKEQKAKATEAAKRLIDILRPAALTLDEMVQESKENYMDALHRWADARENNDKEAENRANESCDIWRQAENRYQSELEEIEDAMRFVKRLIPGKLY